jgi:hypothetical protein
MSDTTLCTHLRLLLSTDCIDLGHADDQIHTSDILLVF